MAAVLTEAEGTRLGRRAVERISRACVEDVSQLLAPARAIQSKRYRCLAMTELAARSSDFGSAEIFAIEAFVLGASDEEPHRAVQQCAASLQTLFRIGSEVASMSLDKLLYRIDHGQPAPRLVKASVGLLRAVDSAPTRVRERVRERVERLSRACPGRSIQRWLAKRHVAP